MWNRGGGGGGGGSLRPGWFSIYSEFFLAFVMNWLSLCRRKILSKPSDLLPCEKNAYWVDVLVMVLINVIALIPNSLVLIF